MVGSGGRNVKRRSSRPVFRAMMCFIPIILGVLLVGFFCYHLGHNCPWDVSTWSSVKQVAPELDLSPDGAVYFRVEQYYAILLCVVVVVCVLNSLSFLLRGQNSISKIRESLKEDAFRSLKDGLAGKELAKEQLDDLNAESLEIANNDWRVKLGNLSILFRALSLTANGFFAAYVAVGFAFTPPRYFDEEAIFWIFFVYMLTDIGLLLAIYGVKRGGTWGENRELLGTLFYIDIPTIISVGLILWFGPSLLSGLRAPQFMFRAIAGGAMIVHLVNSQIIQSILLGEEWFNEKSVRWRSRITEPRAPTEPVRTVLGTQ